MDTRRLCGWLRTLSKRLAEITPDSRSERSQQKGKLSIAPEVRASVHDDGLALLHIPTGQVFLGNRTALKIWQGIVQGLSMDAICEEICREYGIAREIVEPQAFSFIRQLECKGILTDKTEAKV